MSSVETALSSAETALSSAEIASNAVTTAVSRDDEDRALLTRIAGGDEQAMEIFYRQYAGQVTQFAARTLDNPADAAEVCNTVMLEVWRKCGSFMGNSSVRTWLFSITHFKAVDAVRRRARLYGTEELEESQAVSCEYAVEDAHGSAQHAERVKYCLGKLQGGFRQVVYLTFYEGMAYPEIAAVLDIPTGTVKTRMMHAKRTLAACLSHLLGEAEIARTAPPQ